MTLHLKQPPTSPPLPSFAAPRRSARDLTITNWSEFDTVQLAKNALRDMARGSFDRAAQLVEAMFCDDRIAGCALTRSGALPALPITLEEKGSTDAARRITDAWESMHPDYALTELAMWGEFLGVGLGELVWMPGPTEWTYQLRVWHPRFLSYRHDTRTFWVSTLDGQIEIQPGNGQWLLYTPHGERYGHMRGLVRRLAMLYLGRTWGWRDWFRYSEVHGMPLKKLVVPAAADKVDSDKFIAAATGLGNETSLVTPRVQGTGMSGPDTDRYDVELLEPTSRSWECFDLLLGRADVAIAVAILGQNLTTEVEGGSYAAAYVHANIRGDVLQADAEKLGQCLREQALKWWAQYNLGNAELAPLPTWATKPPEDRKVRGETLKLVGEGLTALQASGAQPDVDEILEDMEVPMKAPAKEPPKPEPTGPAAVKKMSAQLLREAGLPQAAIDGQVYADAVVDAAVPQAREILAEDVVKVLSMLERCDSLEEVREGLVRIYGPMSRERLGRLLYHSMVLSDLGGQQSVLEEEGEVDR